MGVSNLMRPCKSVLLLNSSGLESVVKQKFKMHMPRPGMPDAVAPVFDLTPDPREMNALIEVALWSGASFQDMMKRHMIGIKKYPHAKGGQGIPYQGITIYVLNPKRQYKCLLLGIELSLLPFLVMTFNRTLAFTLKPARIRVC